MKRSRRRKKAARRTTVLAVGEGKTEAAFLYYLKSQAVSRGKTRVTVRPAHGGSPEHAVKYTRSIMAYNEPSNAYDRAVLLVDGDLIADRNHEKRLRKDAKGISLLISRPCIEALFMTFLEPERDWRRSKSGTIKRHFHRSYMGERDKVEYTAYASLEALHLDALIAACTAREHEQSAWAYDFIVRLLECMFGDDLTG